MVVQREKPKKSGKIEKPEDREWNDWFSHLTKEDHKKYLAKLGLDDDDLKEMEEVKEELHNAEKEE